MKERLAVGLVQADLAWQDPAENRALLASLLDEAALGLDLATWFVKRANISTD